MNIAILGATGVVGQEMIHCLYTLGIPCDHLVLLSSPNSAEKVVETPFGLLTIRPVSEAAFAGIDYALFAVDSAVAREWAPVALKCGATVIDNSSAFRYDKDIPLVVPEINAHAALGAKLIANPNCTTAIAAVAIYPIYKKWGIERMIVSTYQATSGAGAAAMAELKTETLHALKNEPVGHTNFVHPIPFNLIPHIDVFENNGYTREEMKVVWETHKIFEDDSFPISCTAVRIPTLRAHSESIVLQTKKKVSPNEVRALLSKSLGIIVVDNPENNLYPMPLTATGKFPVEVGRIRQNLVFGEYGIELFVCGDQLLKGAALNAVQILQFLSSHNEHRTHRLRTDGTADRQAVTASSHRYSSH